MQQVQRKYKVGASLLGQTVIIHNGNIYKTVLVTKEIIGYRFGDFVFTKKRGKDSKKK